MEKAERAQLLRQRFKANGGFPFVGNGGAKPKQEEQPPKLVFMPWPQCEGNTARAPRWLKQADEKPKASPRTKRNSGVPVLTKIAAQAPKKLRRRYASAEAILSERAQR